MVAQEEKVRAIIRGLTNPELTEMFANVFVGEHSEYYKEQLVAATGPLTTVIGTSMRDCYEVALQRPCPYFGERDAAAFYMREEMESQGIQPHVISEDEFNNLLSQQNAHK